MYQLQSSTTFNYHVCANIGSVWIDWESKPLFYKSMYHLQSTSILQLYMQTLSIEDLTRVIIAYEIY